MEQPHPFGPVLRNSADSGQTLDTTSHGFAEASRAVLDHLAAHVPLGLWSVTRYDGARQVYLQVAGEAFGLRAGDAVPWDDTICRQMVSGEGPRIAADVAAEPAYALASVAAGLDVGSYVGVPLRWADGQLFGTLCGIDPARHSDEMRAHQPLLELLAGLLSAVLEADRARTETLRALERAQLLAETDALTGLLNRRGWGRFMDLEESRYRRFGDPASVISVDLDGLKAANDTRGHDAGDDLLCTAAEVLRRTLRSTDVIARLGGDEFGVIATYSTAEQTARAVERLRQAMAAAGVSASIGHAPHTIDGGLAGAWAEADRLMYRAKAARADAASRPAMAG